MTTALHTAAKAGDLGEVKKLISGGWFSIKSIPVNAQDEAGQTALHIAALEGHADIVQHLMTTDADIFLRDKQKRTPIDLAKTPEIKDLILSAQIELKNLKLSENKIWDKIFDLTKQNRWTEALKCYNAILSQNKNNTLALVGKGYVLRKQKQYEEAVECFNAAIAIDPNYMDAWLSNARTFFSQDQHQAALKCLDEVIRINPKNVKAWKIKADIHYELQEYEAAKSSYQKVLEFEPTFLENMLEKGNSYFHDKQYNKAIVFYNKIIITKPTESVWNGKGHALIYQGKYEEALKCFDESLKIDPNFQVAHCNRGVALYYLGKYEAAIQCFEKTIETDPTFMEAWCNKGFVLYYKAQFPQAKACFDQALKYNPNHIDSLIKRARILERDNGPAALSDYQNALRLDAKKAYTLYRLGIVYEKGKIVPQNIPQANKHFSQAFSIYKDREKNNTDRYALYRLGVLHQFGRGVTQNHDVAKTYYDKVSALNHPGLNNKIKKRLTQLTQNKNSDLTNKSSSSFTDSNTSQSNFFNPFKSQSFTKLDEESNAKTSIELQNLNIPQCVKA